MSGLKRTVAWLLVIAMVLPMLCVGGFASSENSNLRTGKDGYVVVDQNGKETEVDESWEEKFPYGALALENSSLTAKEGGEDIILKVHRLGGTTGKVSAVIQYVPAVTEKTDGESRYSSAISADDIQVKVEDPLPITKYQPWGMDPEPERSKKKLLSKDGEDGEGLPSTILYPDAESDAGVYEWYTKIDDDWEKIELAQGKEMPVGKEELEVYDFRCVYTVKGVRYSTDSYKGERYEKPEEEVIPEAPADLELNPKPEYTELELADGDNLYKGWLFEVCFAEGETEKEIIISAKEDSLVELEEFATFTIADSVGGYVLDSLNTTILCVEDNDEDEPSAIAFSVQEVTVDKSEGVAKVTVERTGGVTKPLTVDWELEEGSALAGEDFADAKGTISFYGEQTEQTIEVQLINNQIEETDKKDFEIVLSNLKGDEGDGSKIESDKASCTVQLYNTNTADELNAASTLYSVDAQDVSANISNTDSAEVSSGVISGEQVTTDSEMELLSEEETCTIDWGSDNGEEISPLVTNIGKITFRGGNWGPTDSIKLEVSGTGKNEKIYTPLHFRTLYESLHGSVYGGAKLASGWNRFLHGDEEYAYTYFSTKNKYWDCSPRFRKSGLKVYLSAYNPFYVSDSWDYPGYGQNDQDKLSLGIKKFDTQSSEETIHAKTDVNLTRRRIDGSFYLDLYTANDQNIDGVAHYTAENYKEILDPDNGISITEGGQQYGCLYEGSTVQIKLQNTHLTPVKAYVIDKNGGSVYESGSINGNTITFNDLLLPPDKDYVFKVELDRKQDIKINVSYSARVNEDGSYVDNAFAEAYELMKSRNTKSGDITIGYTSLDSNIPSGETQSTKTVSINNKSLSHEGEITISDLKNIQWVNFNLPAEDLIVLNGKAYKGNENIKLELKHLTTKSIYFFYYNEEFLTAQRPMKAVIDATAIYLDNSGNGKIDGYYDEDKGIFIIEEDNGVKDTFVCFMDDGDYEETTFSPIINEDGKICQYFMRPYYTANPVCMTIPSGASDEERMQVMPNFITHITDDNAYAKLTDEQKSYRTIVSGKSRTSKNGKEIYTADGHIKYTAAATAYSYIDIPLGGDTSPARQITSAELGGPENGSAVINGVDYMFDSGKAYYHDESQGGGLGDAVFTWNPKFKGNMLYPFDNPQPIKIPHSIAGDDIPVTTALETWYQKTDGSWTKEAPSGENAP